MAEFVPMYDLESLNETQRQEYIRNVCKHIGVPDGLNLVCLTYLDDGEGPRRLVPYAKRGATEIIRANRGINVVDLKMEPLGGSVVWTATGKDASGRQEMSSGSKYIKDLVGRQLDDAIMTAQTRACRRMTLQFTGAGILDESEVNPTEAVITKSESVNVPAAPTVQVNADPGQLATETVENWKSYPQHLTVDLKTGESTITQSETPEQFSARMAQMRQEAIDQLNAKAKEREEKTKAKEPEPTPAPPADIANAEPKKRRGRKSKNSIDLGVSAPPVTQVEAVKQPVTPPAQTAPKEPLQAVPQTVDSAQEKAVVTPSKSKLTPEQVKPYRQRQFKISTELEANGFAPKEGMGNLDKLRSYVNIMFPDVSNFTEMTTEHWEKYLGSLENKLKTDGPKMTIQHIEETIGI